MNSTAKAQPGGFVENLLIEGVWTIFTLAKDIAENDPIVGRLRDLSRGKLTYKDGEKLVRDLKAKKILKKVVKKTNIVPFSGRNVFNRRLAGDFTYTGEINYMALGSGNTAFTTASTILNTEVYRKLVSDSAFDDGITYVDVFIASGDVADATYPEAGAFIDGGAGADTGQAFSLVVQDFVKSGSMYISLRITLSQAGE